MKKIIVFCIIGLSASVFWGQSKDSTQATGDADITFEVVVPKFFDMAKEKIGNSLFVIKSNYLSSDKARIATTAATYRKLEDVEEGFRERAEKLNDCVTTEVTDAEGMKMGIRKLCRVHQEGKIVGSVILFSYGRMLYELQSDSPRHLELFESTYCPRSSGISGRQCPDYFLKKNFLN